MPYELHTISVKESAVESEKGLTSVMVLSFILAYLVQFNLNYLWGVMNGMTMIAYLPLININFPSVYNVFAVYIIKFICFDVVPFIDEINDILFTTKYSDSKFIKSEVGYELLGFETHNFAKNAGSLYIIVLWTLASSFIFSIIGQFECSCCKKFYTKF